MEESDESPDIYTILQTMDDLLRQLEESGDEPPDSSHEVEKSQAVVHTIHPTKADHARILDAYETWARENQDDLWPAT